MTTFTFTYNDFQGQQRTKLVRALDLFLATAAFKRGAGNCPIISVRAE
jgi:hypothetical protein